MPPFVPDPEYLRFAAWTVWVLASMWAANRVYTAYEEHNAN